MSRPIARRLLMVGMASAGMVAGINIACLLPSTHYPASWWKVAVAGVMCLAMLVFGGGE